MDDVFPESLLPIDYFLYHPEDEDLCDVYERGIIEVSPPKTIDLSHITNGVCMYTVSNGVYSCKHEGCNGTTKNFHVMKTHILNHSTNTLCGLCGVSFKASVAKSHLTRHILERDLFRCHMCDKITTNASRLKNHMMKHDSNMFECQKCHTSYKNKRALDKHQKECMHPVYECSICKRGFIKKYGYTRHTRTHK